MLAAIAAAGAALAELRVAEAALPCPALPADVWAVVLDAVGASR